MGIYSDVLRRRDENDRHLEAAADEALATGGYFSEGFDRLADTYGAICDILRRMHIQPQEIRGCATVEELLDAMLDPENILYEKVSLSDGAWKRQANLILAFDEQGVPLVISPFLVGYRCYDARNRKYMPLNRKLRLRDEAYAVFQPLEGENFSLRSFITLMLRLISPADVPSIALATLAVTLLGLVAPNVNRQVLSSVVEIGEGAIPYLLVSGAVFVLAGLTKGFFQVLKTFLLGKMKKRISSQMQSAVMAKLLLMPYAFFSQGATGKLSNQVRNSSRLSDMIIQFVMNNLLSTVFSLVYITQIHKMAPALTLPALAVLALHTLLSVVFALLSARHTARKLALQQETDSFVFEALKGIQKIQNIGAQKRVYARIADKYGRGLTAELEPPRYILLSETIISLVTSLGAALILIYAAALQIPQADYIAFTASYSLIAGSVGSLVGMCNALVGIRPLVAQLNELFTSDCRETGLEYVRQLKGEIELRDICFRYGREEKICADHISMHIRAGEKVAIVGESGCGKSTLLKLLLGMLEPDTGTILYDGKPLPTLNKRSLRRRIASVFQFSRLFPGTILDNIGFSAAGVAPADAWAAAERAAIADDIRALPLGMETEISEGNGAGFSGGQKQRLMLARAFAQKPSILLLDEATSALDNLSQHKVLESVYGMKCTVLMVAHRLSTVVGCDRIIVLQRGRIAEEGTYEELIEQDGYFAELVRKQMIPG